ncbi:MAG: flagellar biosynthetic protein FliO [Candidatus Sericytochromatia bacterium]|nr:flagellar biosynthetic protein FliO [Candidatus Sericytochromatia bacterium]
MNIFLPPLVASASLMPEALATFPPPAGVTPPEFPFGQFLLNLLLVCGALAGLGWLANRLGKGRLAASLGVGPRRDLIRIEDRLPVDPQRALLVVAVEGQRWLVGMGPTGFDRIGMLGPEGGFADVLEEHDKERS